MRSEFTPAVMLSLMLGGGTLQSGASRPPRTVWSACLSGLLHGLRNIQNDSVTACQPGPPQAIVTLQVQSPAPEMQYKRWGSSAHG